MLDSSSRLQSHPVTNSREWEEATFTRPMRSPFAPEPAPAPDVDVKLEEAALFEPPAQRPTPALRRVPTPPPPRRKTSAPPSRYDAEATTRTTVEPELLRAMRENRDSTRLLQAAIDLGKTVEEPAYAGEVLTETSAVRPRER